MSLRIMTKEAMQMPDEAVEGEQDETTANKLRLLQHLAARPRNAQPIKMPLTLLRAGVDGIEKFEMTDIPLRGDGRKHSFWTTFNPDISVDLRDEVHGMLVGRPVAMTRNLDRARRGGGSTRAEMGVSEEIAGGLVRLAEAGAITDACWPEQSAADPEQIEAVRYSGQNVEGIANAIGRMSSQVLEAVATAAREVYIGPDIDEVLGDAGKSSSTSGKEQ